MIKNILGVSIVLASSVFMVAMESDALLSVHAGGSRRGSIPRNASSLSLHLEEGGVAADLSFTVDGLGNQTESGNEGDLVASAELLEAMAAQLKTKATALRRKAGVLEGKTFWQRVRDAKWRIAGWGVMIGMGATGLYAMHYGYDGMAAHLDEAGEALQELATAVKGTPNDIQDMIEDIAKLYGPQAYKKLEDMLTKDCVSQDQLIEQLKKYCNGTA